MTDKNQRFATRLVTAGRAPIHQHGFVNPAVHRGTTVLYPDMATRLAVGRNRYERNLTYGLTGTPTHWALEDMIAEVEGGTRAQIVSSGLAACTAPLMAYLSAGDHLLVPDSVYGPVRTFANKILKKLGVETTYFDPEIDASGLAVLFQSNTKVLFLESPGSHTFEMQDVPALSAVAHAHGARVLMDNTWGVYFFQPFAHGVDVSIQALTKYVVGHSDVLLGSIATNSEEDFRAIRDTVLDLGHYASPDDCWLALRGARTLGVRLDRQMESGLTVARWLQDRPEIARVLHPALPGAPGHDLWKRDFTGAPALFGIEFAPGYGQQDTYRFAESLQLFGIGVSWGGYESLALPTTGTITRNLSSRFAGHLVRMHVGLEDPADLIADLEQALDRLVKSGA